MSPATPTVVIQVALVPDGSPIGAVQVQASGPINRPLANMLFETGRQLLLKKIEEAEEGQPSNIVIPPPGTRLR